MLGELDFEARLQHLADHRGQQAVVAGQLHPFGPSSLDELLGPCARIAGVSPSTNGTLRAAGTKAPLQKNVVQP